MNHIVHVSNDFDPISGGINTHLKNLLEYLSEEDFKISLLVPTAIEEELPGMPDVIPDESKPFRIVRSFYSKTGFNALKLIRLTKAIQAGLHWIQKNVREIDLIHQHDQRATRLGASLFSSVHHIPMIWTNHSSAYFERDNYLIRIMLKVLNCQPDGVIAVHRTMAENFRRYEFEDIPVRYIPNGVNMKHFAPDDKSEDEKTVVLFPQRMIPVKGAEILAKAAVTILQNYQTGNIMFWFGGSESMSNRDDSSILRVKEILNDFTDTDTIKFLGNPSYEEMPWYYHEADIVVLPLQTETENISVFEAWASGTPLIVSSQIGKNGYMRDEGNCLIVPNNDPERLAEAILRLTVDDELKEKLIRNGRVLAESRFNWADTADKTADFYSDIFKMACDEVS